MRLTRGRAAALRGIIPGMPGKVYSYFTGGTAVGEQTQQQQQGCRKKANTRNFLLSNVHDCAALLLS